MSGHTTTTLAYVRTAAGVVKVPAGEHVPEDVLPSEVLRLTTALVLVAADEHDQVDEHDHVDVVEVQPPAPAPKRRGPRKPAQES